ncbi:MAG: helix-turn-helix domain-containing protein [Bacteroidota bacterium]
MEIEPIVPKLKQLLREKGISHAVIAEKIGKHRAFITKKLGGDSMETRLLEEILRAAGISYEELLCPTETEAKGLRAEINAIKAELSVIREHLPSYSDSSSKDA